MSFFSMLEITTKLHYNNCLPVVPPIYGNKVCRECYK